MTVRYRATAAGTAAAVVAFLLVAPSHGLAADPPAVTSCGEVLDGKYRLSADLDCSTHPDTALTLRGTLELRGFTLTGNPNLASPNFEENAVIYCPKSCSIVGPGTVTGGVSGIVAYTANVPPKKPFGTLKLAGATISNHSATCLFGGRKIKADGATISGCGLYGASTEVGSVSLAGSTVSGAGADFVAAGFHAGAIDGQSKKAKLKESQLTNNFGPGIGAVHPASVDRVNVVSIGDSTISDNGKHGVLAARLSVKGSTIQNNCTSPGGPTCADLESCDEPKLKESTCGTSQDCGADMTWGVCSGD